MVPRLARVIPQGVLPREELIGAGNVALVEAAERWNPAANDGQFWGWAHIHIRGAMLDAVRKWSHYSRPQQAAPETDFNLELTEKYHPEALWAPDPYVIPHLREALRHIRPEQARCLLRFVFAGLSMTETAEWEGVTVSRVSQRCREARLAVARELE